MDLLVSAQWLLDHLGEPGLKILNSSWHMPSSGRNALEEFKQAHIPGAHFLDIDALSDRSNPAPHMLPTADDFALALGKVGISQNDRIIVYDNSPLRTAARGWFMLRHFGARDVAILDGGLELWVSNGFPTQTGEETGSSAKFSPKLSGVIVTKDELIEQRQAIAILDARSSGRFEGRDPDPRPSVARGHIPGSHNLPYSVLYDEEGRFRSREDLQTLFDEAGIDPSKPFVATCGSGVTANSLIFAAALLGNCSARLYDGSWGEWGSDPATLKAMGPA